jgi:hypothetical protein
MINRHTVLGVVGVALLSTAGCDLILGLRRAELYEPGGAGGTGSHTQSTTSTGSGGGGSTGCTPGKSEPCYTGPAGTQGVGVCKAGTKTCNADGLGYGPCVGETTPQPESCASQQDTNCDGFLCSETEWAQSISTVGNDAWGAVATDAANNIYVTGPFTGPMAIAGKTLVGTSGIDVFAAKLTMAGDLVWAKQFGDAGDQGSRAIAVDKDGNTIITGSTSAPVDFGKGTLSGLIYVMKLDPAGAPIWTVSCGGTLPPAAFGAGGVGVALDPDGNIILAAEFGGTANCGDKAHNSSGGLDILLAKLSASDGHAMWSESFGDVADQHVRGIAADNAGNIAITGPLLGSINFGGNPLVGGGFYVARFTPTGNHSWSRQWGSAPGDYSLAIDMASAGGPVVSGAYRSSNLDFGGGPLPAPSSGGAGAFVLALTSSGSHSWSHGFVGTSGQGALSTTLGVGDAGAVVIAGGFDGELNIGGTKLTSGPLFGDTFVAALDGSGASVWGRGFTGTSSSSNSPSALALTPSGATVLLGTFEGSVDFGTGALSSSDHGTSDFFLMKIAPP